VSIAAHPGVQGLAVHRTTALGRRLWWVPLVAGILWLVVSLTIFRFDAASVRAVATIAGLVFLVAGVQELATLAFVSGGWRWVHFALGGILVAGGVVALLNPVGTFVSLAALAGWLLLVKGVVDLLVGLADQTVELWWLRVLLGVAELIAALAVSGIPDAGAVVVIAFAGAWALARGITDVVTAFQIRSSGGGRTG